MSLIQAWGSRPVFVSSTFKDMHAERDHLRRVVFPELAERLRGLRHHFAPLDLRWGIDTVTLRDRAATPDEAARLEEATELLVLKFCLEEIDRSRPFMIVLLGERYGWTPPLERLRAAARVEGYEGALEGRSVTALEIEYGVLD